MAVPPLPNSVRAYLPALAVSLGANLLAIVLVSAVVAGQFGPVWLLTPIAAILMLVSVGALAAHVYAVRRSDPRAPGAGFAWLLGFGHAVVTLLWFAFCLGVTL